MQKLAEICIKRPVFATMLILFLVVMGIDAYFKLGVDYFPKIEFPVVQITTGTLCHLEADMIARALDDLDLNALDLLIIENVGNLVCPASYDLGENLRVVLLSVTEGEDKPLKYPPLFHSADIALITKSDLSAATEFQRDTALANLRRISHHARVFEVSARTGDGLEAWCAHLVACRENGLKNRVQTSP